MISSSIKARIFVAILTPLLLLEMFIFGFYIVHLTTSFNTRYELIAKTISTPFFEAIEKKLTTLVELEDRRGFLGVYTDLKGTIVFGDWKQQYSDLSGVSFRDETDQILVSTTGIEKFNYLDMANRTTAVSSRMENHIAVAIPLIQNKHLLGTLNFWFSDDEINKEEKAALLLTLLIFLLTLVLCSFLSWWFSSAITQPIKVLATDSEQIAIGELEHEICLPDTDDEIGLLTKNFQKMRDAIREKISELEERNIHLAKEIGKRKEAQEELQKHRDTLEETVKDRTARLKVSNEALQYSESRYRTLSDAAFEAIAISKTGVIIEANTTFSQMFGYRLSEIAGMAPDDFFAFEEREAVQQKIRSGFEGSYESLCLRKDDTIFPVEIHERMFTYNEEKVRVTAIRDISEKKEAEEQIKELREMVPICAKCKKIRDDKGYWNIVESYLQQHSDMSFSHGICPGCADELYGNQEWYKKRQKKR